jgi:hypothetical protein
VIDEAERAVVGGVDTDAILSDLDRAVASAEPAARPALIVALAARLAALGARMVTPHELVPQPADESLDVKEAARRQGVSEDYMYRWKDCPFRRHTGRRVMWSARGQAEWFRRRTGKR